MAVIAWKFDSSQERMLSYFELIRSDRDKGHYEVILSNIPAEARKTVQTITKPTNYLKIAAVGKDGSRKLSLPVLVQTYIELPIEGEYSTPVWILSNDDNYLNAVCKQRGWY